MLEITMMDGCIGKYSHTSRVISPVWQWYFLNRQLYIIPKPRDQRKVFSVFRLMYETFKFLSMKKYIQRAALPLFFLLTAVFTTAQSKPLPEHYTARTSTQPAGEGHGMYLNDINIKAKRHFKDDYEDAENVWWRKSSEGIITARFEINGCNTTVYYDKYGSWTATMKNYREDWLPFTVRDRVKSKYYDFAIEVVDEILTVTSNKSPTYIVHIRYKNQMKFIRICDDEMEVWKEFDVF